MATYIQSSTGPEEFSLTEDERRALWRSIDYDGVVNLLTPPANYFQFKFMFHCRALELLLRDGALCFVNSRHHVVRSVFTCLRRDASQKSTEYYSDVAACG